jgi:hypothetical protein
LSRKSQCNCVMMDSRINTPCDELSKMKIEVIPSSALSHISIEPTLQDQIIMAQLSDKGVQIIKENLHQKTEKYNCFCQDKKGKLWFEDRLVVPKNKDLKKKNLDEAHLSKFSMHPGSTKMYHDMKPLYWWTRMKREIAQYVSECGTCQRIKASHLKSAGALQPLLIPSWKWDDISMDFIVGLPNTSRHHDSIWVIVDRLMKVAIFFQCTSPIRLRSMHNCILTESCVCTGYPEPLFLTEEPNRCQILGAIARVFGNQANEEFNLPPLD